MRIGLIADIHAGYHRGTRLDSEGVNQREADTYKSAGQGIKNLIYAGVDVIVDLGDLAHVPAPKKRAISFLIKTIKEAEVPFYSVNGNHTLQRTASDVHLYDLISEYASNFRGYTEPFFNSDLQGMFIPYGTADQIRQALADTHPDTAFIAGHWAANDVPFPGDHVNVEDLPRGIPIFLGHYHTRWVSPQHFLFATPTYIGATERFAWGEANNPTGVAIWDTETNALEFVDHEARRWMDIVVTPDDYLEDSHYDQIEGAISRVTIKGTAAEYSAMDLVALRKKVSPSLEYQIRRYIKDDPERTVARTASLSLSAGWNAHIKKAKLPKGVTKKEVERIGLEALANAGAM
jgi:hypothetical protein